MCILALYNSTELQAIAAECWDFELSNSSAKNCLKHHRQEITEILKYRSRPAITHSAAWDGDDTVLAWLRLRAVHYAGNGVPMARPSINPRRANYPLTDGVAVLYAINTHSTHDNSNSPGWENAVRVLEERRAGLQNNELIG